jgi:hypothetical protein
MQESKYFYNDIPLSKYCKDNNINISTIRARIWKKKQSKKYENYTEQEIVDMVIEAYGSDIKYMYKGISLRQYCLDNGIKIETIYSRINNLRKQNEKLSNDELVILAMEEFDNKNFRFFYKGIPLKEYCRIHPEINYNTIRTYINIEKERNPKLSDEELIEQYLDKEHKGIYEYYYFGIPLKQYCDENNLSYKNIIAYMSRYRNNNSFKDLNDDEFVEAIMDQYQPFEPKYLYKGLTLREYCIQNDLSYYSVISFVKRRLVKGSTKSIDDLIDEGIKTINRYGIIYYYKGMPLKDYALENDLNASSIRCAILRKQLKSNKPLQEIIDECVESYEKFSIKYYYNGIPLLTYCNSIGLNYNTIIQKYLYEYSDKTDIGTDEAIKQIVDYYIEHPPLKTKYYFSDQSLTKFCDENGYPYLAIWRRIKILESRDDALDNDQIIALAIKKYEDKLQIDKISEIFDKLKSNKIRDINEIKNICTFLKIDFENVNDLVNMNFSYNQAINMIWYFSDKKNNDDCKMITDNKIRDVLTLIDNLRNSKNDIEQFELYDLIGIYKSNLYDSRNEILLRQKRYIYKTIYSLCSSYGVKVNNNNYEDFESEIKYYLLMVINRTNLNIYGQIIKYMDLTVKGYFRTYLKKYRKQNNSLSLDDAKYSSDKGTRREKSKMDYIADSNNPYERNENASFSSDMMKVLSSLSPEDLSFIMLKYQENYSDEELATNFNLTLDEIKQKEIEILSLLKNNDGVKVLRKIRNDN